MTGAEVKKMNDEQIKGEVSALRTKLFDLRSQTVTDKVSDTSQFIKLRKDLARMLTERRARQIAKAGNSAKAVKTTKAAKSK